MDQFQTIQSGQGLLKNNYEDGDRKNPVSAALRKRADKIRAKVQSEDDSMSKGDGV